MLTSYFYVSISRYNKPREFEIVKVPLPKLRDDDVLVKVKACGVCGTGAFVFVSLPLK